MFLIKNDADFLTQCGYLKNDINSLNKECKNILLEQNGKDLDYSKTQEESILEKIVKNSIEKYFAVIFEDVTNERSLISLLSVTDPIILRQSKFTDHENDIIRNLALESYIGNAF